jgi:hypothetical protein
MTSPLKTLIVSSSAKQADPVEPLNITGQPELSRWAKKVADVINTKLGQSGTTADRAVTMRDLLDLGAVELRGPDGNFVKGSGEPPRNVRWRPLGSLTLEEMAGVGLKGPPGPPGPPAPEPPTPPPPTVPVNLQASASLTSIILTWDEQDFEVVAYVEVWASATNDLATAAKIGNAYTNVYVDAVGATGVLKWYWIRSVGFNPEDAPSAYNSLVGVAAQTGKIGNTDLTDYIIDANKLADGAIDLEGYKVTATNAAFGKMAVGYAVTKYLIATSGVMDNLVVSNAQIADLDAGKITTGYLNAARIAVGSIDSRIAQITDAQIQSLSASKIVATWLSAITANLGDVTAGTITLNSSVSAGWSYIKSPGKWLDSNNGFVVAGFQPDGSHFFDVKAGNNQIRMYGGGQWGGAWEAWINFGNGAFTVNSAGALFANNAYIRGNVEATSLKVDAANIVSTLHLAGNAVTVPAGAAGGLTQHYNGSPEYLTVVGPVWIDSGGQPVVIIVTGRTVHFDNDQVNLSGNYAACSIWVFRDGATPVASRAVMAAFGGGNNYAFTAIDYPGGGAHHYTVMVQKSIYYDNNSGADAVITLLGVKR